MLNHFKVCTHTHKHFALKAHQANTEANEGVRTSDLHIQANRLRCPHTVGTSNSKSLLNYSKAGNRLVCWSEFEEPKVLNGEARSQIPETNLINQKRIPCAFELVAKWSNRRWSISDDCNDFSEIRLSGFNPLDCLDRLVWTNFPNRKMSPKESKKHFNLKFSS